MSHLENIKSKVLNQDQLQIQLEEWKSEKKKIAFTNGCFDIIHRGHIHYLAQAADLGDYLIVGLNTDDSVRKLKGNNRPVQDENTRAEILASLSFISAVILFEENTPINLIETINPHILIKGGDYQESDIVGADFVKANGGEVKTIPFLDGHSTSELIAKFN
ncbi:D-glycero-beta-D-manno-heptose 1-phosphate adenylyltransferase [Sphingobacteriaceae bacterium AH-315-L07]|nr:D-glycero-beta-D-manno-heptose 1-phosphate adenylyltransferase [Bacteroidia bacterium]MBN4052243.1 D-glycero-beta-D-manno-heptose 1-phosphate adenylyltransferase [Sphingobacteriaceae bacterium AH-315-L07]